MMATVTVMTDHDFLVEQREVRTYGLTGRRKVAEATGPRAK